MRKDAPRVCIIGAGAAGLALAHALSLRGINTRICDAGKAGQGALAASAGMIAPGAEVWEAQGRPHERGDAFARLARHSAALWPQWAQRLRKDTGVDIAYQACGSLIPVRQPGMGQALARCGIEADLLDEQAARARMAGLAAPQGAAFLPGDAQLSAPLLARALLAAIRSGGADISEGARAVALERAGGVWRTRLDDGGVIDADCVVLAAGWAAARLHPAAGGVYPVKGQALMLDRGAAPDDGPLLRAGDVYLAPKPGGRLLVGATAEPGRSDVETDPSALDMLLGRAARHLPAIAGMRVTGHWAGVRPALPGMMPRAGEAQPGLFVALGAYRHGVMLAPAIAEGLAMLIAEGRADGPLAAFAPDTVNEGLSSGG